MLRPHRGEVLDALDVVPHPVAVDRRRAPAFSLMREHPSVDVGGHARRACAAGGVPIRAGQLRAHQVVVAADAAAGDDHRARAQLELADHLAVARRAARGVVAARDTCRAPRPPRRASTMSSSTRWRNFSDRRRPLPTAARTAFWNGSSMPGPGAPDDVEPRHRVAVAGGGVAAALGPADDGEESHAESAQPVALFRRGEPEVGLAPSAGARHPRRGRIRRCPPSPARRARRVSFTPMRRCSGESMRNRPPKDHQA